MKIKKFLNWTIVLFLLTIVVATSATAQTNKVTRLDLAQGRGQAMKNFEPKLSGFKGVPKFPPYNSVGSGNDVNRLSEGRGGLGGYTLIRVTTTQWEMLKKKGLSLQSLKSVIEMKYPDYFGPILVKEGFWVLYRDAKRHSFIKDTDPLPQFFWAAIQIDGETQPKK